MTPEQWQQVREAYDAVAATPPDQRAAVLAELCGENVEARSHVEHLLSASPHASNFLETSPFVAPAWLQAATDSAVGRRLGPYEIVREIGAGGMSTVYLAVRADDEYKKEVAIKLVWPGLKSAEIVRRFRQERQILAQLDHPHIARLLDGGTTDDGWPYLVMEYVDGVPITDYCAARQLSIEQRLKLFQIVCSAVEYAHQNLIVHRDLKPSNILVTAEGTVKLLDFGIAKVLKSDHQNEAALTTRTGLRLMTPEYASPEQVSQRKITTATDIYNLGLILYELLVGEHPHLLKQRPLHEIIRVICEEEPDKPSVKVARTTGATTAFAGLTPEKWRRRLAGDLDNIALKALQKDVRLRYYTVEQLSADVQHHLTGQPVIARPATLRYRAEKYVKRNKAFVAVAAVLLLGLVVGAVVTAWQLRLSRAHEREQRYQLYAADMRQAGRAWGDGDLLQLHELLERHRPGTSSDEWRGFEWAVLWKLLHKEEFTFRYQDWIPAVQFTPDGKNVLVGSANIDMWSVQNGQYLGAYAGTSGIGALTLAFTANGKRLVSSHTRSLTRIWDFASRSVIADLQGPANARPWPNLSPNGKHLAVYWNKDDFKLFDTETGQFVQDLALPPNDLIWPDDAARYAPDGKLYCLAHNGRRWELWDVFARRPLVLLDPQSDDPRAVKTDYHACFVLSHDGRRIYLASDDKLVRSWDIKTGKLLHIFVGHQAMVETPALSPDDRILAIGSNDKMLRLWNAKTGELLAEVMNENATFYLDFSPDGKYLAAVCQRAMLAKVWDVQKLLTAPPHVFKGFQVVALAPDGSTMLTETGDEHLKLRDLANGQPLATYSGPEWYKHGRPMKDGAFSPDGKMVVFGNQVREVRSEKLLATLAGKPDVSGKGDGFYSTTFSPDGKLLATTTGDKYFKLWDTMNWHELAKLDRTVDIITSLAFSPDGGQLAISSWWAYVKVWDIARRQQRLDLRGHRGTVMDVKYSPDGKLLASCSWDNTAKIWDAMTGRELFSLRHANAVQTIAFSPDGRRLVSGGDDQFVHVWDVRTGTELTALPGHSEDIYQLFFTSDGQTLVSASQNESRVWRAATIEEVRAHQPGVARLTSPRQFTRIGA